LVLRIDFHSDDLAILEAASGYGDAWTTPFLDRFYRPIVVTIVQLARDLFGESAIPLRVLQGLLIAGSIHVAATLTERLAVEARRLGALILLASPLTFVAITPFAVGIGDLIVGLCFLFAIRACLANRVSIGLVGLSLIAILSKESGLLVALYCGCELARRRRFMLAASLAALAIGYVIVRSLLVAHAGAEFSTGYFFDLYTPAQLDVVFADSWRLRVYNVIANLADALVGVPEKGVLQLSWHALLLIPAMAATSMVALRRAREHLSLVAVVIANALIGFAYVRPRMMFLAGFAIAVLAMFSVDDLLRADRRKLVLVLAALWVCVLAHSLARLMIQAA
jgi:hypothetical protein